MPQAYLKDELKRLQRFLEALESDVSELRRSTKSVKPRKISNLKRELADLEKRLAKLPKS